MMTYSNGQFSTDGNGGSDFKKEHLIELMKLVGSLLENERMAGNLYNDVIKLFNLYGLFYYSSILIRIQEEEGSHYDRLSGIARSLMETYDEMIERGQGG